MFEWGGGCLWCGNDAARNNFVMGPLEDRLPLSASTRRELELMSVWHDQSLNSDYPPEPGPWSQDEYDRFDDAANDLLQAIRKELGAEFEVIYERL
jgi:hypothetical protein